MGEEPQTTGGKYARAAGEHGFIDLEKAYDTVQREMLMAVQRWMGVLEADVRMMEGTCERTTEKVLEQECQMSLE